MIVTIILLMIAINYSAKLPVILQTWLIGRNISVENKDKEIAANSFCVVTLIRLKLYLLQASTRLDWSRLLEKKGGIPKGS